jgi:hypothetical protein
MNEKPKDADHLPIRQNLALAYAVSLAIAALMAGVSIVDLRYRTAVYPTDELIRSFIPTDVVDLFFGVPLLLGSLWLARRGRLLGLLFWPGALLYVLYNFLVYVFGMPINGMYLLYLTLAVASAYALIGLVASIDGAAVQQRLAGAVPERAAGGALAGLGILFFLRVVGIVAGALFNRTPVAAAELSVMISDFFITPAWVIGGVLLWRRKPLGYVGGMGLLFQASMSFIGLIVYMILQPLITDAPFAPSGVAAVVLMGLICFIPFALFARGVVSSAADREQD